jgi:hypothetical protein
MAQMFYIDKYEEQEGRACARRALDPIVETSGLRVRLWSLGPFLAARETPEQFGIKRPIAARKRESWEILLHLDKIYHLETWS